MFDYPTNPPVGTTVTVPDGTLRLWDGQKWRATPVITRYPVTEFNFADMPPAQPDGSPPIGAEAGDIYDNGGFVCVAH
jgi:hypothetical protein